MILYYIVILMSGRKFHEDLANCFHESRFSAARLNPRVLTSVFLCICELVYIILCICELVYIIFCICELVYYKGFGKLLSRIPVPGGTSQSQGVRPLGHPHPLGGGVIGLGHVEPLQMSQSISLRKSSKLPFHPAGDCRSNW